jgi:hypothetical protein
MESSYRKNHIKKLRDNNGNRCESPQEMQHLARDFFKDLYEADPGVCPDELVNLPCVWLESRGSGAELTLVLGTAPTLLMFGCKCWVGVAPTSFLVWLED